MASLESFLMELIGFHGNNVSMLKSDSEKDVLLILIGLVEHPAIDPLLSGEAKAAKDRLKIVLNSK